MELSKKEKNRRKKIGLVSKSMWKDPEYLEKMKKRDENNRLSMIKNNPMKRKDLKENASKIMLNKWQNDNFIKNHIGKNSNNWKGGTSRGYSLILKEKYFHKNNCFFCDSSKNLDIHHIDKNYHNNNINNLIIVCRSCHNKLHRQT